MRGSCQSSEGFADRMKGGLPSREPHADGAPAGPGAFLSGFRISKLPLSSRHANFLRLHISSTLTLAATVYSGCRSQVLGFRTKQWYKGAFNRRAFMLCLVKLKKSTGFVQYPGAGVLAEGLGRAGSKRKIVVGGFIL